MSSKSFVELLANGLALVLLLAMCAGFFILFDYTEHKLYTYTDTMKSSVDLFGNFEDFKPNYDKALQIEQAKREILIELERQYRLQLEHEPK